MNHSPQAISIREGSTWDLDNYAESGGWEGVGIAYSHNRDSDTIYESNWRVITNYLAARFGRDGLLMGDIDIAYFTHWAIGWVEYCTYNTGNKEIQSVVDHFHKMLADYPVIDEMDYSDLQHERGEDQEYE